MRCSHCGGRGWFEGWQGGGASWAPALRRCPRNCDTTAYAQEAQRRLNDPTHVTDHLVMEAHSAPPPNNVVQLFRKPKLVMVDDPYKTCQRCISLTGRCECLPDAS